MHVTRELATFVYVNSVLITFYSAREPIRLWGIGFGIPVVYQFSESSTSKLVPPMLIIFHLHIMGTKLDPY